MRSTLLRTVLAATCLGLAAAPGIAHADVAYVDGNEIWLSTPDGSQKLRLSGGENDWRDVAVSDQGYVVGVRNEAGKIADLSTFAVWDPQGNKIKSGPMVGRKGAVLSAFPLNLQLTPDAGLLVYGYSGQFGFGFPVSYTRGFALLSSDTVVTPALDPIHVEGVEFPALVGSRVVGAMSPGTIGVQEPDSTGSDDFTAWPGIDVSAIGRIDSLDVSSNGTRVAINTYNSSTSPGTSQLWVVPAPGLGLAPVDVAPGDQGACKLPTVGSSWHPSFSLDGSLLAWGDDGGVKIVATPQPLPTPLDCILSSPVVTLSATGDYPSIGPVSVAAIAAARNPATGGGGGGGGGGTPAPNPNAPVVGKTSGLKLTALISSKGGRVEVTSPVGGKATVSITVAPKSVGRKGTKPITVASGKGTLVAGKKGKLKLKATKNGKALKKKLKGKKVQLVVTVGGITTTKTFKLS